MGKKYIAEIGRLERLYKAYINENGKPNLTWLSPEVDLTPYTEPDLEQVRKEAYDKGYDDAKGGYENGFENGMIVAWDVARKIQDTGGNLQWWIHNTTASEAIEKIRQYEQEQEEIKVGNEVKGGDERYVVLQKYLNNIDEPMAVLFNRRDGKISVFHLYNGNGAIFGKTGRHFPEIAAVFEKMREGQDGQEEES